MKLRSLNSLAALFLGLLAASCATVDTRPNVVIDGRFGDWESTQPVTTDPQDAPNGFVDFGVVKVRHDRDAVYLMFDVGRIVTAQRLSGTVSHLLDVDGDPRTGHAEYDMQGVDIVLEFPLPNEKEPGTPGAGIRLRALTAEGENSEPINAYSVGFILAPVHAGNVFEMRIDRRGPIGPTPPLFQGERFSGKLVAVDLQDQFVDATDTFTYALERTSHSTQQADASIDPLRRVTGTDFRILFWNIARGAYIRKPEPFSRVLSAVRPDIIVFDEVPNTTNAKEFAHFLEDSFISNSWNVYYGQGGDHQRTVVASRAPVKNAEPFSMVQWDERDVATLTSMSKGPDAEQRVRDWLGTSVPTGGAIVTMNGRSLLVVGVDLQCCGGYETAYDRRRIIEAESINKAVRATVASSALDGVIVGGDFNLVGDPAVLSITGGDATPGGGSLDRAYALQIDGLSDATWANPDEPFVPGRLDNVLFSKESLAVKRAFVFDSNDLAPRWQAYYGVRPGDNPDASDHFPVVVDFEWIDNAGNDQ